MCGACGSGAVTAPWDAVLGGHDPRSRRRRGTSIARLAGLADRAVVPWGPTGYLVSVPGRPMTFCSDMDKACRSLAHRWARAEKSAGHRGPGRRVGGAPSTARGRSRSNPRNDGGLARPLCTERKGCSRSPATGLASGSSRQGDRADGPVSRLGPAWGRRDLLRPAGHVADRRVRRRLGTANEIGGPTPLTAIRPPR